MALNRNRLMALQQLFRAQQQQEDGLVSFRAGRMHMNSNKLVTADDKPGKVRLVRSDEGIVQFQWVNRISGQVDLDIMLFPNTSSWNKIEECKDGRVYLLKFNGSSRREFFWMQEPSTDKDNEYFEKINKLCKGQSLDNNNNSNNNNMDVLNQAQLFGMQGQSGNNSNADALQNLLMAQLGMSGMNGFGGLGNNLNANANANANTNTNANTNANVNANANANPSSNVNVNLGANRNNASNNNANLNQLLLSAINNASGTQPQNNASGQNAILQAMQQMANNQREQLASEPDLADILDPNENGEIAGLLDDEKIIEDLGQFLPENMRSQEDIIEQLQSPQFQASLRRLQGAINGPQMSLILQQMGLPPVQQMGVRAFLRAIQQRNSGNASNNNAANNNNQSSNNNNTKK